jgi:hypothetical protein
MWDSLVPRLPTKNPLYSALLLDMPCDALRESHGTRPRRVNSPPVGAHSWVLRTSREYFGSPSLTGMGGTSDGAPKNERRHPPLWSGRMHEAIKPPVPPLPSSAVWGSKWVLFSASFRCLLLQHYVLAEGGHCLPGRRVAGHSLEHGRQ